MHNANGPSKNVFQTSFELINKGLLLACCAWVGLVLACHGSASAQQVWAQMQGDALRSGNAVDVVLDDSIGLIAAVPTSDAIFASPVISETQVFVLDGSGLLHAFDRKTLAPRWTFQTDGGSGNCNNIATPSLIGQYIHVATMAGFYYVIDQQDGSLVAKIDCGEPIFSAPAVADDRVYFATVGAQVYAVQPAGEVIWQWDFVKQVIGFHGDRWSGADWLTHRGDRVTWKDHFVCSRDICLVGKTIVMPAGGRTVFLDDAGDQPKLRAVGEIPAYAGSEYPATFGQSADAQGNVYVQWHRRDNAGRLDVFRLTDAGLETSVVSGTETAIHLPGLLSFAPVSVRGDDVYRVRPEQGLGLMRHRRVAASAPAATAGTSSPESAGDVISESPSIMPPVLTRDHAVYGDLAGNVVIAPLGDGETKLLATAMRAPLTAPLAIVDGQIYAASEDGYLYVFGPGGKANVPERDLEVWRLRSPLAGKYAGPEFDWYTNYGDFSGTNANDQGLEPPLRMRWARRLEGTIKHLPVCGGGRLYIHTAEGQIIAYEQDTGRMLWRRYWPDVYLSFTSPLYHQGKLLVPQAGMKQSLMRCLDAETGKLLWEAPFTGSPSWSRQFPPVVAGNVAIYASGSGNYAAQGTEKAYIFKGDPVESEDGREVMSWIYSNDNPYYPKDNRPLLWGWDLDTGKIVWQRDFSEYGRGGNDCGICLLDGKLFYSTFFGYSASLRQRRGLPVENNGLTACLDPQTGEVLWTTNKYYVTAKCTLSARDGRIYIGGFNRAVEGTDDRFVWCLDAKDGNLVWQSEPVTSALNVVTVGPKFIFSNALRGRGNVFDRETGAVIGTVGHNYACCRFTLSEPYVLGANMDMIDLSRDGRLVSTGPAIDSRECLGAVVSNGRIFYASQASGFLVSQTYGEASSELPPVWDRRNNDP
jgi:outer membrane protein assembly factor BamB